MSQIIRSFLPLVPALWIALVVAGAVHAAPTNPVVIEPSPEGQGDIFVPGVRLVADLSRPYVEEEFLISGRADLPNYAHNPPHGPTDIFTLVANIPYRIRAIVRRPANPARFNGTVVVEWWNSTAGWDTAPVWDTSAEYFARKGIAYVGITNSTTSLDFLKGGCRVLGILPPTCGTRYATLSLPENGLAFDIANQLSDLLKSDAHDDLLPPEYVVERLYHAGQSQQGGSVITYASGFHIDANDGYFVQQAASARRINYRLECGEAGAPNFPFCTPRLLPEDRRVRTDLPVPVVHVNSQTDIEILFGLVGRQPDTPTFRYYEVAGGSHLMVHKDVEIIPPGVFGPDPVNLEDLCVNALNTTADGPVYVSYVLNAIWDALEKQVTAGVPPPPGVVIDTDPVSEEVQLDVFGNATGGIQLPATSVRTATYTSGNAADPTLPGSLQGIGNLACRLASSLTPLPDATIDALYPTRQAYLDMVATATDELIADRYLLAWDGLKIRGDAAMDPIFCGIGFEVALVLPPIMWLRARRRRSRADDR